MLFVDNINTSTIKATGAPKLYNLTRPQVSPVMVAAIYNSPTAAALPSATLIRKKIATAQSHNFLEMTNTGTSGSFSRVRCSCRRRDDILRKLATETTRREAAVSRLMVA